MDSTKIGDKQFLIVYLSTATIPRPLFYSLHSDISTQNDYAELAKDLVTTLADEGCSITSFCTDGLKCQTNALNGTYTGFLVHFFHTNIYFCYSLF
jgi:hypothetical protein